MSCTEEDAPYIVPVAGSRTVRYLLRVINTTNRYEFPVALVCTREPAPQRRRCCPRADALDRGVDWESTCHCVDIAVR